jgi:hypothetical protein
MSSCLGKKAEVAIPPDGMGLPVIPLTPALSPDGGEGGLAEREQVRGIPSQGSCPGPQCVGPAGPRVDFSSSLTRRPERARPSPLHSICLR